MTCDDVIRCKGKGLTTRAERAALLNHVRGCPDCQRRVMETLANASPESIAAGADRLVSDRQDPEYLESLK